MKAAACVLLAIIGAALAPVSLWFPLAAGGLMVPLARGQDDAEAFWGALLSAGALMAIAAAVLHGIRHA